MWKETYPTISLAGEKRSHITICDGYPGTLQFLLDLQQVQISDLADVHSKQTHICSQVTSIELMCCKVLIGTNMGFTRG
jgi:hypothetical protein